MSARPLVLVVEDDPDAAGVLGDYLERAGFRVRIANAVAEALAAARGEPPDAVVTDVRLRGDRSGLDLLEALACGPHPPPVLVAVSGYATADERDRARGLGIGALLAKPFDPAELAARLRAGLAAAPGGAPPAADDRGRE